MKFSEEIHLVVPNIPFLICIVVVDLRKKLVPKYITLLAKKANGLIDSVFEISLESEFPVYHD